MVEDSKSNHNYIKLNKPEVIKALIITTDVKNDPTKDFETKIKLVEDKQIS